MKKMFYLLFTFFCQVSFFGELCALVENKTIGDVYLEIDFDSLQVMLRTVERGCQDVAQEQEAIKAKLTAIETNRASMKAKLTAIETNRASMKAKLTAIETNQASMKAKLTVIETNQGLIKAKSQLIAADQALIKAKQEKMFKDVKSRKQKKAAPLPLHIALPHSFGQGANNILPAMNYLRK